MKLGNFSVDVEVNSADGTLSVYIDHDGGNGEQHENITAEEAGAIIADFIDCIAEGYGVVLKSGSKHSEEKHCIVVMKPWAEIRGTICAPEDMEEALQYIDEHIENVNFTEGAFDPCGWPLEVRSADGSICYGVFKNPRPFKLSRNLAFSFTPEGVGFEDGYTREFAVTMSPKGTAVTGRITVPADADDVCGYVRAHIGEVEFNEAGFEFKDARFDVWDEAGHSVGAGIVLQSVSRQARLTQRTDTVTYNVIAYPYASLSGHIEVPKNVTEDVEDYIFEHFGEVVFPDAPELDFCGVEFDYDRADEKDV